MRHRKAGRQLRRSQPLGLPVHLCAHLILAADNGAGRSRRGAFFFPAAKADLHPQLAG